MEKRHDWQCSTGPTQTDVKFSVASVVFCATHLLHALSERWDYRSVSLLSIYFHRCIAFVNAETFEIAFENLVSSCWIQRPGIERLSKRSGCCLLSLVAPSKSNRHIIVVIVDMIVIVVVIIIVIVDHCHSIRTPYILYSKFRKLKVGSDAAL